MRGEKARSPRTVTWSERWHFIQHSKNQRDSGATSQPGQPRKPVSMTLFCRPSEPACQSISRCQRVFKHQDLAHRRWVPGCNQVDDWVTYAVKLCQASRVHIHCTQRPPQD